MNPTPKIIIACDSFKGSLSSAEVAAAAAKGIRRELPVAEIIEVPVADGGEGTMSMLVDALHGHYIDTTVSDPIGRTINARYGIVDTDGITTAIIEMAAASGLTLLSDDERDPKRTSTRGTGDLIADAYAQGCRRFIIGIGGSATNDGGSGMLRALGIRFLDSKGDNLPEGGQALQSLYNIDQSEARRDILDCEFTIICDVDNPLTGPDGASRIFGPQKGASENDVRILDSALCHYAECISDTTGHNVSDLPGAGAAGGMGAAFLAFFNARLRPGIETTLETIHFADIIHGADLVITGEGKLDRQTLHGKTPYGILRTAMAQGIPAVAIGGAVEDVALLCDAGFSAAVSIQQRAIPLAEAMDSGTAATNVSDTVSQIIRLLNISGS